MRRIFAFGGGHPGGSRIITAVLHTILNLIDCGMTSPEAVNLPRFHQQWLPETTHVETFAISLDGRQILLWLGDADAMTSTPLPQQPWIDDEHTWVASAERRPLKASYLRLHENLLDLTRLRFRHVHGFGTPDDASAPFDMALDEAAGRFAILRRVLPIRLPPLWALATGLDGVDAARIAEFMHQKRRKALEQDMAGLEAIKSQPAPSPEQQPEQRPEISTRAEAGQPLLRMTAHPGA